MHASLLATILTSLLVSPLTYANPIQNTKRVASGTFDDLLRYYKYASSTYVDCPRPLGNTMVTQFEDSFTDTQGFVARDDGREEIIVAWRGSSSITDFLFTDASVIMKKWTSPGIPDEGDIKVHSGFQRSYNAVADQVISIVGDQLSEFPNYSVVITGHSLGGSLASLAGASLKSNFPEADMALYTYGQPRTGNQGYADLVNGLFGDNSFRFVRTIDGVPTAFPMLLGYRHHGVEYWQTEEPATASTIFKCAPGGEDPECSNSQFSNGFTPFHLYYFGLKFDTPFCE